MSTETSYVGAPDGTLYAISAEGHPKDYNSHSGMVKLLLELGLHDSDKDTLVYYECCPGTEPHLDAGTPNEHHQQWLGMMAFAGKDIAVAWAEYNKVLAAAWAEYNKVRAPARAEYDKAIAAAWAKYEKVIDVAWAKFDKVRAPAWAKYEAVRDPAWAEFDKATDAAWAKYEKDRDAALLAAGVTLI